MQKVDKKKVREAIEVIKANYPTSGYYMLRESLDIAIEALEKQLPKRPRENGMSDGLIKRTKYYTCQTCGNCLLTEMMNERQNTNYCWDCGQRLDWSE